MKILRYDDDENTWEPRENLEHLEVFKEYIAQHGSGKDYAKKSSKELSAAHAALLVDDDEADDDEDQSDEDQSDEDQSDEEQSDEEPQSDEDEDDGHNETAEIDEPGKGIQTFICRITNLTNWCSLSRLIPRQSPPSVENLFLISVLSEFLLSKNFYVFVNLFLLHLRRTATRQIPYMGVGV